jgi:hypothetical protein
MVVFSHSVCLKAAKQNKTKAAKKKKKPLPEFIFEKWEK